MAETFGPSIGPPLPDRVGDGDIWLEQIPVTSGGFNVARWTRLNGNWHRDDGQSLDRPVDWPVLTISEALANALGEANAAIAAQIYATAYAGARVESGGRSFVLPEEAQRHAAAAVRHFLQLLDEPLVPPSPPPPAPNEAEVAAGAYTLGAVTVDMGLRSREMRLSGEEQ